MERKTVTKIPAMPFALMYATINAVIGVIMGVFFAVFFGSLFSSVTTQPGYTGPPLAPFAWIFGIGAIVAFPIGMFISGLIFGLIFAAAYNFLAPRIGGIKLYFETEPQPATTQ